MTLGAETRAALAAHLLPHFIENIAAVTMSVVARGSTERLTRATAHADATEIANLAAALKRKLLSSQLTPVLGMVDRLVNKRTGIDDATIERLIVDLSSAREAALAVEETTRGAATDSGAKDARLIWELPSSGARLSEALPIVHAVMWSLFMSGVALTGSENSIATRCVAMVLQDAGMNTEARNQVREWLRRHPPAPSGGRYIGAPNSEG